MKKLTRFVAMVMTLSMLAVSAFAETTDTAAAEDAQVQAETVATDEEQQAENAVLATVNGENVMQSDVDAYAYQISYYLYSQGYDITNSGLASQIQSMAIQGSVEQTLFYQKAHELGFDQFTAEEEAELTEDAQTQFDARIENYISSNITLAEDATDADKAAARDEAIAALAEQGYTLDAYLEYNKNSLTYDRMYEDMVKDAQTTDEEVQAAFDAQVESDKATYAEDVSSYEMAMYYYGQTPYYTPEGYRGVTHILLSVDDDILNNYKAKQAALEEAQDKADKDTDTETTEATDAPDAAATDAADTKPTAEPEPTAEPVTQEDVDAAYAAVIASVQDTIDEIKAKLADGVPFADLVAEYGTDPGMKQEPTKTDGYSVHMDSIRYDPAFVKAAFSVNNVGDVSEPYVGEYGVYIVCYVRDVPAGPVEFTDELKATITANLVSKKQQTLYANTMDAWLADADVVYTDEGNAYLGTTTNTEE